MSVCKYCGDMVDHGTCVCQDCYREILFGEIPPPVMITAGKAGGHAGPFDDDNPAQSNAIRAWEDSN